MVSDESARILKGLFGHYRSIQKKCFGIIPDGVMRELEAELEAVPEYETVRNLVESIVLDRGLKRCLTCGRLLKYSVSYQGHRGDYCSYKCIGNSSAVRGKRKATNLEKYGAENPMKSSAIVEKAKRTNLERYGVDNPAKNEAVKDRIIQTNLKRYGTRCTLQDSEVDRKSRETCLKRYGHEYSTQSPEINRKRVDACMRHFGVPNSTKSEEVKKKIRHTVFAKEYRKLTERCADYAVPLFGEDDYLGQDVVYRWKCVRCGREFEQKIYTTNFCGDYWGMPRCPFCYPPLSGYSYLEKEIADFVKSAYSGEIIENDRSLIHPYELDIVLPERRLAIEFDGVYWHGSDMKPSGYHLMKTEMCERLGYQLIHVMESEWNGRRAIVEDRIRSVLGQFDRRMQARECTVREIGREECGAFLEANHLQGSAGSAERYGLYCGDELVMAMTFGRPRFAGGYDFELIRLCSKLGVQVVGGCSRLLCHFRRRHPGVSIVSYADRRYSVGRIYESSGFVLKGMSRPGYVWMGRDRTLSRYQCQKERLAKILGDAYDPALSESENMSRNEYYRIYDCGNLVYVLET